MSELTADDLRNIYVACQTLDWPTIEQIARETGLERQQVERGTMLLIKKNLLAVGYKSERLLPPLAN